MIRWARPSTIAVLPTPGSPMSTGLFFVRRLSTCTTRRISLSRPMTGSSLPSLACAVRSVEYFSSAWYVPSGSGLVTRRAAADLDERVAKRLRRGAVAGQQLGHVAVAGRKADQQVLGGDVFVVHLGGQLLRGC